MLLAFRHKPATGTGNRLRCRDACSGWRMLGLLASLLLRDWFSGVAGDGLAHRWLGLASRLWSVVCRLVRRSWRWGGDMSGGGQQVAYAEGSGWLDG